MDELPLFPLATVLFPEGLLELKIFEARYLDLVSRCLRERAPFGVVALRSGSEARGGNDDPVQLHDVGTLATLIDVDSAAAGILLVRCRGGERFRLRAPRQAEDGLWLARVESVAADREVAPAARHAQLVDRLREAIGALAAQGVQPFLEPHRLDSASWVGNRWCEILGLPLAIRQRLMALADPLARLDAVEAVLGSPSASA
jgi:Lon protease-like protein